MTNSIFAIMEYCMIRGLEMKSNLGSGIIYIYDPVSNTSFELKADIDAKVSIEKIETLLDEYRSARDVV